MLLKKFVEEIEKIARLGELRDINLREFFTLDVDCDCEIWS